MMKTHLLIVVSASMLLSVAISMRAESVSPAAQGSYAVVVTHATHDLPEWRHVVDVLRAKHDADLVVCESSLLEAGAALRTIAPNYACFVARPEETGRSVVVGVHRLTRALDNDPYTDLMWGILTGYEAADALRIAERREPLIVKRAASSMGAGAFKDLDGGFASNERKPHVFSYKRDGGEVMVTEVNPDPAKALAEAFNTTPPDAYVTSGHATERDWQIGYNVKAGQFRCDKGQLYALSTDGQRYDITSPHPKVYLPVGNCLIGHIPRADCMALAWMHTGGVDQMFGYTAVTFHGYMGWGTGRIFQKQGGQYTLAEAFYLVNQSLVHELRTRFPDKAGIDFDRYDHDAVGHLAEKHGISEKTLMGHLWDRDSVAFYGDPAWSARWSPKPQPITQELQEHDDVFTFRIVSHGDGKWGRYPVFAFLPDRIRNVTAITCSHEVVPVVTDNFILVPLTGKRGTNETVEVRFRAERLSRRRTSARSEAIHVRDPEAVAQALVDPDEEPLRLPADDPETARAVMTALRMSGENGRELVAALRQSEGDALEAMLFLVANMPLHDLRALKADFLLENVEFALKARQEAPWGGALSKDLFLNDVLPYASLNEQRDAWRKDFYERFMPIAKESATPGEAAVLLNKEVFDQLNVKYHATKRPKPDQSPYESIDAGFASCTGLSILLVDACRAVGIPARIAGIPKWPGKPGNHTWVEVWDDGWRRLGARESKKLDGGWFLKPAAAAAAAAEADPSRPLERLYASSFKRLPLRFPLPWAPYVDYVSAIDVTASYRAAAQ